MTKLFISRLDDLEVDTKTLGENYSKIQNDISDLKNGISLLKEEIAKEREAYNAELNLKIKLIIDELTPILTNHANALKILSAKIL